MITLWLDLEIAKVGLFLKENFQLVYSDLNMSRILTHLIVIQKVLQDEETQGVNGGLKSPHHPPQ